MRPWSRSLCLAVSCASLAPAAAWSAQIDVIYTKIAADPTGIVPGALDGAGMPAVTTWRAMEDLRVAQDGSAWVLKGRTQLTPDQETILVKGSGLVGTMFCQEGQPIPTGAPGELYDFFSSEGGGFNSLGHYAFGARAKGGVASVFQKIMYWNGASLSIVHQMGNPLTGLVDTGASGDELFGNSVGTAHPLDDGRVGLYDTTIQNISSLRRPALFYDRAMFQQINVTMATGLAGIGARTWSALDSGEFVTTPDGAHWIAEGQLTNAGNNLVVLVLDDAAVLQELELVSTSGLVLGDIFKSRLLPDGTWLSRGRDNSGTTAAAPDWAVRNGTLIAKTGDAITPTSAGENWGDTLSSVSGNVGGDYIVVGNTNNANPALNEVLVLNGTEVIAREGDMVDLNNNGLPDDDAFIGRGNNTLAAFQADDVLITDDRVVWMLANLRNAAGVDLNNAGFGTPDSLLRIVLPPLCPGERGDANCDNAIDFFDIDPFLLALFDPPTYAATFCGGETCTVDVDCSTAVDFFDIDPFLECLFSVCPPCP